MLMTKEQGIFEESCSMTAVILFPFDCRATTSFLSRKWTPIFFAASLYPFTTRKGLATPSFGEKAASFRLWGFRAGVIFVASFGEMISTGRLNFF